MGPYFGGEIWVGEPRYVTASAPAAPVGAASSVAPDTLGLYAIEAHRAPLSALALHASAPIVASGSRNQFIKLFDLAGLASGGHVRELQTIRYFDGFLGARIGPVSCLCWHPSRLLLAAGATEPVVSLWQ